MNCIVPYIINTIMLTVKPHLTTRRPSPTTIEYCVSTCPELTISKRLLFISIDVLRLILAFSTLLILHSKWLSINPMALMPDESDQSLLPFNVLRHALRYVHSTQLGTVSANTAALLPAQVLLPLGLAILYFSSLRLHTTEALLVLRGLGIQTSTSGATYLSGASTRFIPTENIQDILVNEAFRGFEVRYYLAVVVKDEAEVVVVFPELLPPRKVVEHVWRGARDCLWEGPIDRLITEDERKI